VIDGATNTVTATIQVGALIEGIAVNPSTDRVYVSASNEAENAYGYLESVSGTVYIIDGSTNTIVGTIAVANETSAIAVDPSTNVVYVMSDSGLVIINGSTDQVVTTLPLSIYETYSPAIAVDPVTNAVYVAATVKPQNSGPGDSLYVVSGATDTVVSTPAGSAGDMFGVAVDPSTNTIYYSIGYGLEVINGTTNTVSTTETGFHSGTFAVGVNPVTDKFYTISSSITSDDLYEYNGATNDLSQIMYIQTIPSGFGATGSQIAVNPDTNTVYIADGSNGIYVINGGDAGSSLLTVNSVDTNGNALPGFYTVLYDQGGNQVDTGSTPAMFPLTAGQTYTVQADSYGSCYFDHWQDTGSSNSWRMVSITSDTQITAVYNCNIPGASSSSVTLQAIDVNDNATGNSIFGYYATIFGSNGNVLATGLLPVTFPTTAGESYTVQVDNYGSCVFEQWTSGGSPMSSCSAYLCWTGNLPFALKGALWLFAIACGPTCFTRSVAQEPDGL
jgi:DNA-binding beta-propeller fold protein YncE